MLKQKKKQILKFQLSKFNIKFRPCRAMCEMCRKEVTTYAKTEYNVWAPILTISLLYFFGLKYGIILILIFVPLFKNVVHMCPNCFEVLLIKNFYPIQLKDKVNYF
jgi:hypothetical protein